MTDVSVRELLHFMLTLVL